MWAQAPAFNDVISQIKLKLVLLSPAEVLSPGNLRVSNHGSQ